MKFKETYKLLTEKKDHLINKLNLTSTEKDRIIEFFNSHRNLENKIDWNRKDLTMKDFDMLMNANAQLKISLGDAKLKEDYIEVNSLDPINRAFIPLTHKGSCYIASNKVNRMEGKWCIATRNQPSYWQKYSKEYVFIMYITPLEKFALQINKNTLSLKDIWNKEDHIITDSEFTISSNHSALDIIKKNKSLLYKAKSNIEDNRIKNLFKPDSNGNILIGKNNLTSLKGSPQKVKGDFKCYQNKLTSLEGGPKEIGGNFNCSYNNLNSLEGAPQKVGGDFVCNNNDLTSLEGGPKEIGKGFYCSFNKLKTLKGAPQKVGEDFYCSFNKLKTLKGAPKEVGGDFRCNDNKVQFTEDDVRAVCNVKGKISV